MQIQSYSNKPPIAPANIESQCPHGQAPGACPACSGGGGGGGGKKAIPPGLMGWDEAAAAYRAAQMDKTRQMDYLHGSTNQHERLQREVQAQAIQNLAQALLTRWNNGIIQPFLANFGRTAANTLRMLVPLLNIPRNLAALFRERGLQPLIDITDKLAIMLGDAKKLLDDIMHHNNEVLKSLIAQWRWQERMAQVQSLFKRILGQFSTRKILQGVEVRVKALFARLMGLFEQPRDDKERF